MFWTVFSITIKIHVNDLDGVISYGINVSIFCAKSRFSNVKQTYFLSIIRSNIFTIEISNLKLHVNVIFFNMKISLHRHFKVFSFPFSASKVQIPWHNMSLSYPIECRKYLTIPDHLKDELRKWNLTMTWRIWRCIFGRETYVRWINFLRLLCKCAYMANVGPITLV